MDDTKAAELPPEKDRRRGPGRRPEDHDRAERASLRERFDQLLPAIIAGIVVLLAVLSVLSVAVFTQAERIDDQQAELEQTQEALREQQGRSFAAIRGSCERLQRVRDDVNALAGGIYRVLAPLADNESTFAPVAAAITRTMMYLPPTDCEAAVLDPGTYKAPEPIPFSAVAECYDAIENPAPEGPCRTAP